MPRYCLEDFEPGLALAYGPLTVSLEEMLGFSRRYDPQPMHIDAEAARGTFAGKLIASGWGTASLNMRMICDGFLLDSSSMGGPGVEELKWLRPVEAGDTLTGLCTVLERRASASKPDRGIVRLQSRLANQRNEVVLEQTNVVLFGRRGIASPSGAPAGRAARAVQPPPPASAPHPLPWLEDLVPGQREEFGTHHFDEAGVIDFARAYDPQPFHIDREAAKTSIFGGIIASGWQTGACWMRLMIDHRRRAQEAAAAAGLPVPRLGPSPGIRDLRWLAPVYAGDTISYASTVASARPSASRPGWGIATHHNTGTNQFGETVFAFTGAVLWPTRPA